MSDTITPTTDSWIEDRGGCLVRVDAGGGCAPATRFEISLWKRLQALESAASALCDNPSEDDDWEAVRGSDLDALRALISPDYT